MSEVPSKKFMNGTLDEFPDVDAAAAIRVVFIKQEKELVVVDATLK